MWKGWQSFDEVDEKLADRLVLHADGAAFVENFRYEGVGRPVGLAGIIVRIIFSLLSTCF